MALVCLNCSQRKLSIRPIRTTLEKDTMKYLGKVIRIGEAEIRGHLGEMAPGHGGKDAECATRCGG